MVNHLSVGVLLALVLVQGEPLIETRLAWDGKVSTEAFTELALEGTSSGETSVAVESTVRPLTVTAQLELGKGVTGNTWIPVGFVDTGDTALRYSVDGGPWIGLDAGRLERGSSPVILAGASAVTHLGHLADTTTVSVLDLPRLPLAYAHVAAVVLDSDALARLDEQQLRALLEHVGVCGRLLLIDAPIQVEKLIAQRAGCGGRNLMTTSAGGVSKQILEALMSNRGSRLPDERALSRLIDDSSSDVRLLTLYLGGFLLMFVALTVLSRSRKPGVVFSLVATVLAGLLWTTGNHRTFVAWAEASTTDRVARYVGLERASATGRGEQQLLQMQSLARSPVHITGDGLVFHWNATARDRYLDWSAVLLQKMQILSTGSFPVDMSVRAQLDGEAVVVCNLGDGETPSGYLRWRGVNYEVPALQPGARWTVDAETVPAGPAAQLKMLARRSADHTVSLLHPLEVPANGGSQEAWLMRTESETTEGSPCRS